jgi:hypothetical protein
MAKQERRRCPVAPAIPRRCSCHGQQDPIGDGWLDLALKENKHHVSEVRRIEIERMAHGTGPEEAGAH